MGRQVSMGEVPDSGALAQWAFCQKWLSFWCIQNTNLPTRIPVLFLRQRLPVFLSLHLISCSIISPSSASWLIPGLNATATACLTALWHFGTIRGVNERVPKCQSVKVPKCHHNFFSYTPRRSFFRNGSSSPTSNMRKAVRRDMPMTSATARA